MCKIFMDWWQWWCRKLGIFSHSGLFFIHSCSCLIHSALVDWNIFQRFSHIFNRWLLFDFYNCFPNFPVKLHEARLEYLFLLIESTTLLDSTCPLFLSMQFLLKYFSDWWNFIYYCNFKFLIDPFVCPFWNI